MSSNGQAGARSTGSARTVFLDVNETLIRTGSVSLPERLEQEMQLERVRKAFEKAATASPIRIVLISGNSFEYCRRVEEPLGLRLLPNVQVIVVSENGLVARDLSAGLLWKARASTSYQRASQRLVNLLKADPANSALWDLQVNEVRVTLKPRENLFSSNVLNRLRRHFEDCNDTGGMKAFWHPFYVDLDPVSVAVGGRKVTGLGKGWAVHQLMLGESGRSIAIGDSASDVPMFEAVRALGGACLLVANAKPDSQADRLAMRLRGRFADGVAECLESLF